MFDTDTETQDRGQVGIGTLIVFIALVLVAAIAGGVLINTAGFLQTQAEQTGEESTAQAANNVQFSSVYGTANSGTPEINTLKIQVQLAPGSEPIDLSQGTLEVFPDGGARVSGSPDAGVIDSGDTVEIDVDTATGGSVTLGEGASAEIVFTTPDGSQTETVVTAPNPITSDNEVRL